MNDSTSLREDRGPVSWLRICTLVAGYLLVLASLCLAFGVYSLFSILVGIVIVLLASQGIPEPSSTWRSTLVAIAGGLAVFVAYLWNWIPRWDGCVPAWFMGCYAFRQFRDIFHYRQSIEDSAG